MTEPADGPINLLEAVIRTGMTGAADGGDLVAELLRSAVFVPSAQEVQQDGSGLIPLLLRSPRDGAELVVAFTDMSRIGAAETERAPYCLQVAGEWLVRSLAPAFGIVLFAGPGAGCELSPQELARVRQSLAS
jgi:hypothetical protein